MSEHAEHPEKVHPIAAVIMLVIIGVLAAMGLGALAGVGTAVGAVAAGLLFLWGLFAVFTLGKP